MRRQPRWVTPSARRRALQGGAQSAPGSQRPGVGHLGTKGCVSAIQENGLPGLSYGRVCNWDQWAGLAAARRRSCVRRRRRHDDGRHRCCCCACRRGGCRDAGRCRHAAESAPALPVPLPLCLPPRRAAAAGTARCATPGARRLGMRSSRAGRKAAEQRPLFAPVCLLEVHLATGPVARQDRGPQRRLLVCRAGKDAEQEESLGPGESGCGRLGPRQGRRGPHGCRGFGLGNVRGWGWAPCRKRWRTAPPPSGAAPLL